MFELFEHVISGAPAVTADAHRQRKRKSSAAYDSEALRLYQVVWKKVGETFFDVERLTRWERWEHRFDWKIRRSGDATKFINRMLKSLKDEYTWLRSPEEVAEDTTLHEGESVSGIGIIPGFTSEGIVLRSVFSGSPAEKGGLKPRDVVVAIDDVPVGTLDEDEAIKRLRGKKGTTVKLNFRRDATDWECVVMREKVCTPSVHTDVLPNGVGYLKLESFQQLSTVQQMRRALKRKLAGCSSLVLDLRANEGGYIDYALECAAMFINYSAILCLVTERVPSTNRYEVTVHYCGRRDELVEADEAILARAGLTAEEATAATVKWNRIGRRCVVPPQVELAVLVDADTASAGELLTGALKDSGRAVTFGTRTFGKGIGQTTFKVLGSGVDVQVTTLHYRTPAGVWPGDAQRLRPRIKPSVTVRGAGRLLMAGFEADKQLQVACRHLHRRRR